MADVEFFVQQTPQGQHISAVSKVAFQHRAQIAKELLVRNVAHLTAKAACDLADQLMTEFETRNWLSHMPDLDTAGRIVKASAILPMTGR